MNSKAVQFAGGMVVLVALLFFTRGCQQYGEVSPKTYEYATAIFGACSRRDDPRNPRDKVIAELTERIDQSVTNSELSQKEADWLIDILQMAKDGQVKEAAAKARLMMEEQVQR